MAEWNSRDNSGKGSLVVHVILNFNLAPPFVIGK